MGDWIRQTISASRFTACGCTVNGQLLVLSEGHFVFVCAAEKENELKVKVNCATKRQTNQNTL